MPGPRGHRWFALAIRLLLSSVFVLYGTLKLLGLQLSTGDLSDMRFGDASPMLVTWHFFSLSVLYHDSIGIAQIVTGVLLVFSRTAPIGALCFFVIILNIVLINFGYDIATDVKILSTILLFLNCLLIGHYWPRYRLLLLPESSLDKFLEAKERRETLAPERGEA